MTNILLWVLITLIALDALLNMATYRRLWKREQDAAAEKRVVEAMDAAAEQEARRSREIDEGFDNVMGYSVKLGWGKTTGGEP
jgi:hypothetical protein